MTRVAFITGHEDTPEAPADTPEAYWRVYLPGRIFGSALILGRPHSAAHALEADVVWIYQPTGAAAANLAELAQSSGKRVIVDFSEDVNRRVEADRAYSQARLDAAERCVRAADFVVVSGSRLADAYQYGTPVRVIETVLPLDDWKVGRPAVPPTIAWWSDGRQKFGFEECTPALRRILAKHEALTLLFIQYPHMKPIVAGMDEDHARAASSRLHAYLHDDQSLNVEANMRIFRDALAGAVCSIECYPAGEYRESVSDVPLLRAAALGVPSVTTRDEAPPGAIPVDPEDFEAAIESLLSNPGARQALSREAREWAESRQNFDAYKAVIEEVTKL